MKIKKILAFFMVVSMTISMVGCSVMRKTKGYTRVVVVGVDGAGAFFDKTSTPNMDEIFKDGAKSYKVLTSTPTVSAQCWGSLLTGTTPENHGLTNDIAESKPYENAECPTVFKLLKSAKPDIKLSSSSRWIPINEGIIERDLDVSKASGTSDEDVANTAIRAIRSAGTDFLFVQFDDADHAGHSEGYGSEDHLKTITYLDTLIGKIYKAVVNAGYLEETLFVVTADHGGTPQGSHGGLTDAEKYIFFGAASHTVNKDAKLEDMTIRDIAAIILSAFKVDAPTNETWAAKVPEDLFL